MALSCENEVWSNLISEQVSDRYNALTELHPAISIRKGATLWDKPINGAKSDGKSIAFAEISGSQMSWELLESLDSFAKSVNSLASLQEIKNQNAHVLVDDHSLR